MSKANNTTVEKVTSVSWIKPDNKINKKVIKSLEEWAAKILCRDNDHVKNKANADNKTKKRFDRTKTHRPKQYAMSNRSYKLNNQDTRNSVHIVHFTPQEQRHKSPDQLFLHVGDFMKGEIDKMTKTTDKKNANQKIIKLLNSANEAAACLVALANKDRHKLFSSLEEMQAQMREELTKKRNLPMKVVKRRVTMMTMMNRCQKQLHFKLNINSVCTFSSNSKLEYFAGKLRAL
jgi:hypothetical protein